MTPAPNKQKKTTVELEEPEPAPAIVTKEETTWMNNGEEDYPDTIQCASTYFFFALYNTKY